MTDAVKLVKDTLSANWTAANVDNVTPTFREPDDAEELRGVSPGFDVVKVYTARPQERRRVDFRYDYATWISHVAVEGVTSGTSTVAPKAHGEKIRAEVERIINAKKNNPDGYWNFMLIDDIFDVQQEYSNFFRFRMTVDVQRLAGAI